jgi:flagellar basal-body rod modification protein FlgD
MPVSSATSSPSIAALTANPANAATARVTKRTLGQEDFLKLITVQLSSQDPLKPMEDTAFIAQMAQFTSLEQSSSLLSQITTMNGKQDVATANSYLGRQVTVNDGNGRTVVGEATGVEFVGGLPRLVVGDHTYAVSSVVRVAPMPAPAVAGAAS